MRRYKLPKKAHLNALIALLLGLFAPTTLCASPQKDPGVVSTGKIINLKERLEPEKPTLFLFLKPGSTLERDFLNALRKEAGEKVGVRTIELKTGLEPIAAKYDIIETPTALVFDRRGRLTVRSSRAEEIQAALKKAAGVMRIDWAEEGDPLYTESVKALGRPPGTGILRIMTLQPEYLKYINDLSIKAHFSDGYLPRRVKEIIATYVSQLNRCKY